MATISEALAIAIEHHQGGRLQAAEQIYRQILQVEPNHADALHLLGVIASMLGKPEMAIEYMARAVQRKPDYAEAHSNLGLALNSQGRLEEAVVCYRRALALKPDYAEAHNNLGNALSDQRKLDEAAACYRRALALKPDFAEAHYNLGNALKDQGKLDEAAVCYRRALSLKPDFAEAHNNLGVVLSDQGKLDEAIACYRRALALKPDFAEAHNNLGVALSDQGKLDEAVACYRRALALKPDYAEAHSNLGLALSNQGKLDEAVACYRRALALKPDFAEAHNNLGNALKDQGKLDEAVACYRRALALHPNFAEAHNNLGLTLSAQGKLDEAVACYRRALALKPDYAEAHNNLGNALKEQGNLDEAVACYRRALALKPDYADANFNQSLLTLLTGDFERGWGEYEWRWKTKQRNFHGRYFAQPLWDGQPLAGSTILLHAEQGLGDTIQFVRYVHLVKERGGRVVVECQPPLLPLLADCPGIDQALAQGEPLPAFEVQAPLLSLPGILGTTLGSIPARVPYLRADPELAQSWRQKLEALDGFKVGIVWQGNPQVKGDRQRSIPLRYYEALARVKGVRLVSLQKGPGADQLRAVDAAFPVLDLGQQLETFRDTAAVLQNLDLLISSCTSVPHLAGALGVPVWLALPFVPDWRWLLERADSPWYPHHRLFRQSRPGDWSELFERIAGALRDLVATRAGGC